MSVSKKSSNAAILGVLIAVTLVLQGLGYIIPPISGVSLSFVLIPIVLTAVMYGTAKSTIVGTAFGVIVTTASIIGIDPLGAYFFNQKPITTILMCTLKGVFAGLAAGLVVSAFKNKNLYLATLLAAIVTPVVNTGIFLFGCYAFLLPQFESFSQDNLGMSANAFVTAVILINFAFELIINIVFAPAVLRVCKAFKK